MDSQDSRSKVKKAKASPRRAAPVRPSKPRALAPAAALDPEQIHRLIAEAAYYRAERRGFAPGDPTQDWLEAEAEVMVRVRNGGAPRKASSR